MTEKRRNIRMRLGMLVIIALALGIMPTQTKAQSINCTAPPGVDSDNDGLTDVEECNPAGLLGIPSCFADPTTDCLHPQLRDLFAILVPASPSHLPANPLQLVSNTPADGGLGLRVHLIDPALAPADRSVTATQKAVRITESLQPDGTELGVCNYGTPNDLDDCRVFTQRIIDFVHSVYADCGDTGTPQAAIDALIIEYIRHVIAHENGHSLALTVDYNKRFGGNHYKPGSDVIMEQWVTYTCKRNTVQFSLSTAFADPSIAGATLR